MSYNLWIERPEILGSGSNTEYLGKVETLEEALEACKKTSCNRITKHERVNGRLVEKFYDFWTGEFR